MLSASCLFFVITGIQFWISYYMEIVLEIDKKTVFICFSIVCITAPTLGVVAGGFLIQRFGGYDDSRAIENCLKLGYVAMLISLPIPFISSVPLFVIFIWLLLFFGGSIVPGLTGKTKPLNLNIGIMLCSIPEGIKEVAYSFTHLCYNLFGYLPAPILYGLVNNVTGCEKSRCGLGFLMMFSVLGVGFLFTATLTSRKLLEEKAKEKELGENLTFDEKEKERINILTKDNTENISNNDYRTYKKSSSMTNIKIESLSAFFGRPSFTT